MNNDTPCVVTLFARAAKLGQVKKRLAVNIGESLALLAHKFLVKNTLRALDDYTGAELQVWVDDNTRLHCEDPLYSPKSCLFAQKGESLGERMANALSYNLELGKAAIVIGSDCPLMDVAYIQKAKVALQSSFDVVIGPAEDGGYVLIGMNQMHSTLFEGVDWGTEKVLAQTLAAANKLTLRVHTLDTLWDVDRVEDLEKLSALNLPHYPDALKDFEVSDRQRPVSYASTIP